MTSFYVTANEEYSNGFYERAVKNYSEAMMLCEHNNSDTDLFLKCLSNRAQCFVMQRCYDQAACDCSSIIAIQPSDQNVIIKALIRRANCNQYLGKYEEAISDLQYVTSFRLSATLLKTTLASLSNLKSMAIKDELVLKAEGRPLKMVTSSQALRLNFMSTIPRDVIFGEPIGIKLCIGNELGLWDRDILASVASSVSELPYVSCELLQLNHDSFVRTCSTVHRLIPERVLIPMNGKIEFSVVVESENDNNNGGEDGCAEKPTSVAVILLKFGVSRALGNATVFPVVSLPLICRYGKSESLSSPMINLSQICADACADCIRYIKLPSMAVESENSVCYDIEQNSAVHVHCFESIGYHGIGGKVWDSSFVLMKYLFQNKHLINGKNVLELGSGTGVLAIALHSLGPRSVILTDLPEVVTIMNSNIILNDIMLRSEDLRRSSSRCASGVGKCEMTTEDNERRSHSYFDNYVARAFAWGSSLLSPPPASSCVCGLHTVEENEVVVLPVATVGDAAADDDVARKLPIVNDFDIIVASDVVYYPEAYGPLVSSLCQLLVRKKVCRKCMRVRISEMIDDSVGEMQDNEDLTTVETVCILAHRNRHPDDHIFFRMVEDSGILSISPIEIINDEVGPVSGADGMAMLSPAISKYTADIGTGCQLLDNLLSVPPVVGPADVPINTTFDDVKLFCIRLIK